MTDQAAAIRPGEELDGARIEPWLRGALGEPAAPIHIEQFPGGHSNLTYLVHVGAREYVLRRPPFGSKVKTAHDMAREFRVLSALAPGWPRAPQPIAFCDDEAVLGARFYLMKRIHGQILRKQLPPGVTLAPELAHDLCESFVDTLAELHGLDWRALGLSDFGKPEGYVERQVSGWIRRYQDARTDEVPAMESVGAWLAAHLPPSPAPTIIHNDYKYDNLILDPAGLTRIVGILDWEMATIGDPLADLGSALSYWVEAGDDLVLRAQAFGPTAVPGSLTRAQLAERYAARSGRDLTHILFYYVLGLYKSAVIVQQIYYRYQKGLTKDERFAALGLATQLLARQAALAVETGRL